MRPGPAAALAAFATLAAAALAACGSSDGSGGVTPAVTSSGIDLLTEAGPTCPVQQSGQKCVRPISAKVEVLTQPGGRLVLTVQTGPDGTAHVGLAPGTYLAKPLPGGSPLPRPPAASAVTVAAGAFARVILDYDTGIR